MARTDNGYIKLYRGITDSPVWKKPDHYIKIWLYLLTHARFQDGKDGLKAGQLMTSTREIREACACPAGFRNEMLTDKQVGRVLRWMEQEDMITRDYYPKTGGQMGGQMGGHMGGRFPFLCTICNFNDYQDKKTHGRANGRTDGWPNGTTSYIIEKNDKECNKNVKNVVVHGEPVDEYPNVYLTNKEYRDLDNNNDDFQIYLSRLNSYLEANPDKRDEYMNRKHYNVIRYWMLEDEQAGRRMNADQTEHEDVGGGNGGTQEDYDWDDLLERRRAEFDSRLQTKSTDA